MARARILIQTYMTSEINLFINDSASPDLNFSQFGIVLDFPRCLPCFVLTTGSLLLVLFVFFFSDFPLKLFSG